MGINVLKAEIKMQ